MSFPKIALAALISVALAGCGDEEKKTEKKAATAPAASVAQPEGAKPAQLDASRPAPDSAEAGVQNLSPSPLQADKSLYWSIGGGAELPFIYFGKTQNAGSIVAMIPRMIGVQPNSGDEALELLKKYSQTSDAFAKRDIEVQLAPLLEAKVKKFASHNFFKIDIPSGLAQLQPYDFDAQAFPIASDLFISVERQKQADADMSRYTNQSEKFFLQYHDSKGFRLGFINGEQLRSVKIPPEQARVIEAARSANHALELHVYGSPARTTLSKTAFEKEMRTVLFEGQYVEIIDITDGNKIIYGGGF